MILFDEAGEWGKASCPEYPQPEDTVGGTAFCHAAVMMKKDCLDAVGGYTEDRRMLRVEDVNLWIKLYAAGYRGYNIQEPLYRMRNDQNALNRRKYIYRINSTYVRLKGCRMLNLGPGSYLRAFVPMINGLVPARLRQFIRKRQRRTV
jgi:glycosyltransferase EpsE